MAEKSQLRERICFVLKHKDATVYSLTDSQSKRSTLTRQINQNTAISADTIELILTTFPDVSAEWLLRGEGTMDKSGHFAPNIYATNGSIVQGGNNKGDATISNPSQFELYGKDVVIASKDAEIATLHNMVVKLEADKEKLYLLLQAFTKCSR